MADAQLCGRRVGFKAIFRSEMIHLPGSQVEGVKPELIFTFSELQAAQLSA
jgi:hypothetical protein